MKMKRPLVWCTFFYIGGIIAGRYFLNPSIALLSVLLLLGLLSAFANYCLTKSKALFAFIPLLLFGMFNVNMHYKSLFDSLDGSEVRAYGTVSEIRTADYGYETITLDGITLMTDNEPFKYGSKVTVYFKEPQGLNVGYKISVKGVGERLNFMRNPGGFDERSFMLTRGIGGKISDAVIINKAQGNAPMKELRQRTADAFADMLPKNMAELMNAMVLGDQSGIDSDDYWNFQITGVAHMFSISGLHMSFLCLAVFYLLKKAGINIQIAALLSIIIMSVYCVFTGAAVATVRAVWMMGVIMMGYILQRGSDMFTTLSFSALIILMYQPLFLWDAGFLLSYSAVIGLSLMPIFRSKVRLPVIVTSKTSAAFYTTIFASVFTLPVAAYFFGYVSIIGVVVNMLVTPFAGIITALGIPFIFLSSAIISTLFISVIYVVLKYFLLVTNVFAVLPFAIYTSGRPAIYNIIIFYILIALIYLYLIYGEKYKKPIAAVAVACIVVAAALKIPAFFNDEMKIVFLDVKQGDSAIIHLPDNVNIMIDGGGSMLKEIGENTGRKIVYPYLNYSGITTLDAVFMTHPDMDHAAGVIEILELVKVKRLFISDVNIKDDDVLNLTLKTAKKAGVPVTYIKNGYSAEIGKLTIDCIYPDYSGEPKDINNASLVLKLKYGEKRFLFTGDIEKEAESKILSKGIDLKSDLLKVPHHGSKTSSTEEFVKAAAPEYAIVGTGKNNNFGHPAPEVVAVYEENMIPLINTAAVGAIIIKTSGEAIDITTMKDEADGSWKN